MKEHMTHPKGIWSGWQWHLQQKIWQKEWPNPPGSDGTKNLLLRDIGMPSPELFSSCLHNSPHTTDPTFMPWEKLTARWAGKALAWLPTGQPHSTGCWLQTVGVWPTKPVLERRSQCTSTHFGCERTLVGRTPRKEGWKLLPGTHKRQDWPAGICGPTTPKDCLSQTAPDFQAGLDVSPCTHTQRWSSSGCVLAGVSGVHRELCGLE